MGPPACKPYAAFGGFHYASSMPWPGMRKALARSMPKPGTLLDGTVIDLDLL